MPKVAMVAIAVAFGLLAGCSGNEQANRQVQADNSMMPMHDMTGNGMMTNGMMTNGMSCTGASCDNMMANGVGEMNRSEDAAAANEHGAHHNKTDR